MVKKILNILIPILITCTSYSQGGPPPWPPGNGNGGPPQPCPPFDPACPQVPLSDWYWEIGLMVTGMIFIYYKFKQKESTI